MNKASTEPDIRTTITTSTEVAPFWNRIQKSLFEGLEDTIGASLAMYSKLIYVLNTIRIESFVPSRAGLPGRPSARRALARAFLVKAELDIPTTTDLITMLKTDSCLRRLVGFERLGDIPHESNFSRAFAYFARIGLSNSVHQACVRKHYGEAVIIDVYRDSTAVEARERPAERPAKVKEPKKKPGRKRGVPPKPKVEKRQERQLRQSWEEAVAELPCQCDMGAKMNSKGHNQYWHGYKLHVDVTDFQTPLSAVTTSASTHDSQVAIPLMKMTSDRVLAVCYQIMDKGYVGNPIIAAAQTLGQKTIIAPKMKRGKVKAEPMDPATAHRYKKRSGVERFFAELKDNHGGRHVRVRTQEKVHLHLMLGLLCIFAHSLLRM